MPAKITGFDKLQRDLEDVQRALRSLDGTIAKVDFDPSDPQSAQNAIRQIEAAIDNKTAAYRGNALVSKVVQQMKERYREQILDAVRRSKWRVGSGIGP